MKHCLPLCLSIFIAACGTLEPERSQPKPDQTTRQPVEKQASAPVRADPPAIEIHEPSDNGRWRAVYRLEEPVSELRFFRDDNFRRAGEWNWRIKTPGYEFSRQGRHEALVLADGATPRRQVEIEFGVDTDRLPRDYELFEPFTDGSVALYTGHFLAWNRDNELISDFLLVPAEGDRLLLEGRFRNGPAEWSDPEGHGTFAYFGGIQPIETDHMIAIVDPGMPEWVKVRGRRMLPAFFEFFSRELRVELAERPTVLFGFEDADIDNVRQNGGALPGLVHMSIVGRRWREAEAQMSLSLFATLAHEAAHLWNGRMARPAADRDAWLAEGGADALAWRALRQIGLMNPADYEKRHRQALADCTRRLGGRPVETVVARGDFKAAYSCGSVMFLWAEYALAGGHRPTIVFDLWSGMIERAENDDVAYDRASFARELRGRGITDETIREMNRFLTRPMENQSGFIETQLKEAGVRWH